MRARLVLLLGLLLLASVAPAQAAFPGANGKIAFSTNRDGNLEIYTMDPNGANPANVTQFPSAGEDLPSWSPDGTKLTFVSSRTANFEIFTMNADGSAQTNISNHASFDADPVWCTNTRIVFASLRAGTLDVWAMNSDGSSPVNLTPFTASSPDDLPDCSPDGSKIVYESYTGSSIDIITMNADGTNKQTIVTNPADDVHPSWSPDGTRILFERSGDIYAVDTNGANETLIIGEASQESAAVWSPDGAKIVFTTNRHGNPEIYTANADGSSQTRLTNNVGVSDDYADWQPSMTGGVGGLTELTRVAEGQSHPAYGWPFALTAAAALTGLAVAGLLRRRS